MVVEVMGRTKGWIATYAGIAAGADAILVPELETDLDSVAETIRARHRRGRTYSIVVVAEGCKAPGRASRSASESTPSGSRGSEAWATPFGAELERLTGFETPVRILGHLQRGGTPTAFDRVLATRFGVAAVDLAAGGRFGEMAALRGKNVVGVPLAEACAERAGRRPRTARRGPDVLRVALAVVSPRLVAIDLDGTLLRSDQDRFRPFTRGDRRRSRGGSGGRHRDGQVAP